MKHHRWVLDGNRTARCPCGARRIVLGKGRARAVFLYDAAGEPMRPDVPCPRQRPRKPEQLPLFEAATAAEFGPWGGAAPKGAGGGKAPRKGR